MKTFLFPGQGSQSPGMGGDLFDRFAERTQQASDILGYSIKVLCLENPEGRLNQTQYTQPALFVVNALSYFERIEQEGGRPDYVAGHSLGEFNALLAADCFDFETGLKLVAKRGELMSQAKGGGMAAVLNGDAEELAALLKKGGLDAVHLANFNTPSQIVISGLSEQLSKAVSLLDEAGMRVIPLKTSGAFHSPVMGDAGRAFGEFLQQFRFSSPSVPVISNVTATPYPQEKIEENLASQITSAVRWTESIQFLLNVGNDGKDGAMEFEEIGHGSVLTKLVGAIKRETPNPAANSQSPEKNPKTAEEKITDWNRRYPIGTRVKSAIVDDEQLETRTEAVVLFGHRAAVYLKGFNGYFDLDEITPIGEG